MDHPKNHSLFGLGLPGQIFSESLLCQHLVTCGKLPRFAFVASGVPSCDLLHLLVTQSWYLAMIIFLGFLQMGCFLKWWVSPITMAFPTRNDQHLGWRLGENPPFKEIPLWRID